MAAAVNQKSFFMPHAYRWNMTITMQRGALQHGVSRSGKLRSLGRCYRTVTGRR
jgi:hypothetical protein